MPSSVLTSNSLQRDSRFVATNWNLILTAGREDAGESAEALAKLCRIYWYPLYVYVRRKGHSVHDAEDLTQGFFAQLMQRQSIRQVRGEGKFRSYLLAALEHFLAAEWNHTHRQKRGGTLQPISLDSLEPETRDRIEPRDECTPQRGYDRQWAMTVLEFALDRLREECIAARKEMLFERLKGIMSGDRPNVRYAEIGAQLKMSEVAVKVAAHRLRQRYAELVRAEIGRTLTDSKELESEVRSLLAALAS